MSNDVFNRRHELTSSYVNESNGDIYFIPRDNVISCAWALSLD